jgi:hypothetical protein
MLRIVTRMQWWWARLPISGMVVRPLRGSDRTVRREHGQSTAEYALVMLAAAAIALVLLAWARSSGKLPAFFDRIIDRIVGSSE